MECNDNEEYKKICKEYGIIITGIPCGSDEFISAFIDIFLEELQEEVNKFKKV